MRAPYQVLVIPYKMTDDFINYAIFNRRDMDYWQWIAGGGEDFDDSILESAKREAFEEANISEDSEYIQLDSRTTIPVVNVGDKFLWGDDILVIDEYSFGVRVDEGSLQISEEHKNYRWVSYSEAMELLKYDSNKTAMWELNTRLTR